MEIALAHITLTLLCPPLLLPADELETLRHEYLITQESIKGGSYVVERGNLEQVVQDGVFTDWALHVEINTFHPPYVRSGTTDTPTFVDNEISWAGWAWFLRHHLGDILHEASLRTDNLRPDLALHTITLLTRWALQNDGEDEWIWLQEVVDVV